MTEVHEHQPGQLDFQISIEMQKKNYREMIRGNPKWKF